MELWLIRHTSVACAPGTCYGRRDVPLAETFAREAAAVRAKLPATFHADCMVVSSPAQRCRHLAATLGATPSFEEGLWELDFGAWEGRLWQDIARDELDPWAANYTDLAPPGGETFQALQTRAMSVWSRLLATDCSQIVCVTHAGVIRALLAAVLEFPLRNAFVLQIDYGGVTHCRYEHGRLSVRQVNL